MRNSTKLGLFASLALLSACGSGVRNASPRIKTIPLQLTPGGTTFSIKLSDYVTDREGGALAYAVKSGGGTITLAGAVATYTNQFATLGTYPVTFTVSDSEGHASEGSFSVRVTTAKLALVKAGDDLQLLDIGSNKVVELTNTAGATYTYQASLKKGHVVYQRQVSSSRVSLYVFDPNTAETVGLGVSTNYDYAYRATTSDQRVVFTRTSATNSNDTDLFVWRSDTGVTSEIAAGTGTFEGNPVVATDGLIYYELAPVSGGQHDIYVYDLNTNASSLVSNDAQAETLVAAASDGGVLFTRKGGGGETDLFFYSLSGGVAEVGSDLGATVGAQSKTYKGKTTDGKIVFEAQGTTKDIYIWDSKTGSSRTIGNGSLEETFVAVTAINEVVIQTQTGSGQRDLAIYRPATNAAGVISVSTDNDVYNGALANGDVIFTRETATGHDLFVYDTSANSSSALQATSTDNYTFNAVLGNNKVAYTLAGGSGGVFIIDPATTTVSTVSNVAGATYGGLGPATGDVVAVVPVSSQTDLVLWDESASNTVTMTTATGDEGFGASFDDGKILFTRKVSPKTTRDLFVWNQTGASEARVTDTSDDHSVVTTIDADAR